MAYAILSTKKQKSSTLKSVAEHNRRKTPQPHTDPNGVHHILIGSDHASTADAVNARLSALRINKHRKDATVAVELMCTASPEYFRPENPEKWGTWGDKETQEWADSAVDFLQKKYGENLVEAVIHLDEATPHIHAIVVPAMQKNKKARRTNAQIAAGDPAKTTKVWSLCAKDMFNREELIGLQDEYAGSLKNLGLQRGLRKSKATHESVKSYYGATRTNIILPEFKTTKISKPPVFEREKWTKKLIKTIENHYKKQFEELKTKTKTVWNRAQEYERKYKRERARNMDYARLDATPEQIKKQIDTLKNENSELKEGLERANFHNNFLSHELKLEKSKVSELEGAQKPSKRQKINHERFTGYDPETS